MEKRVTPNEVTAEFEAMIERARKRGETLVVERNGKIICRIEPTPAEPATFTGADFLKLLKSLPPVDDGFAADVNEAVAAQPVEIPGSRWE